MNASHHGNTLRSSGSEGASAARRRSRYAATASRPVVPPRESPTSELGLRGAFDPACPTNLRASPMISLRGVVDRNCQRRIHPERTPALLGLTREQRNHHKVAIFQFLQFYFTLVASLLACEVALCTFAIPYILKTVARASERAPLFVLLALLPLTVLFLVFYALVNVKQEYAKLIEYLTVEQKLEAALGLQQTLEVVSRVLPTSLPYPRDNAFIYKRWLDGRMGFASSKDFVTATVARRAGGAFAPLRSALVSLACADAILLFALVALSAFVL